MKHFAIRQLMAQAAWDRGLDPERLPAWRAALLAEIARGRRVSSRGHFNPRGVKRKMSNFSVRHRGAKLHRRHEPRPRIRICTVFGLEVL